MKKSIVIILILAGISNLFAQPNTNVYLFDIVDKEGKISFENMQAVANNNGYNNQPSFYDDNTLMFVSTRDNQTDIVAYKIDEGDYEWLTNTPGGSEYSPLRIPNTEDFSAIRLDTTGLQRLYRYTKGTNDSEVLIEKLKVGYHVWDNENQLVSSVLVKDGMNLMLNYVPEQKNNTIDIGVGRSLLKIPDTDAISYTNTQNGASQLSSFDSETGKIKALINIPFGTQDLCWLNDDIVLIPSGSTISSTSISEEDKSLNTVYSFPEKEIFKISRMAISPDGKKIAIVSDESPELLLERQVESFNAGDLEGFVSCFSDSIAVNIFPNKNLYTGNKNMHANYAEHMAKGLNTQAEVIQRMVIGDIIIDEEIITEGEDKYHQAVIYEIERGKVSNMTFIHEESPQANITKVVNKEMDAYNARSLAYFKSLYADGAMIYNYPNNPRLTGKEEIIASYGNYFEKATDLEIVSQKRMVVGNKVIDDQIVSFGKSEFRSIAIYEIVHGVIQNVTFIR